jgi:hypothetical protein
MLLLDHLGARAGGRRVRVPGASPPPRKAPLVADVAFDPAVAWKPAAALSRRILCAEPPRRVRERRSANYRALVERIGEAPGVRWIRRSLPAGCSPWILPVLVDEPEAVRDAMLARGVQSFRVWGEAHPGVDTGPFPAARFLKRHVLGLPVHQELRAGDVERIARALLESVRGRVAPEPPGEG